MNTWCLLISLDTTKEPLLLWWILYYQWWWWIFPQVRGFWENDNSFPACTFFFKVEIRSHTVIPLFRPGSVHSGSASWDKCGRVFPDELRVSSFPDRFQRHSQPTLTSRLPRMHKLRSPLLRMRRYSISSGTPFWARGKSEYMGFVSSARAELCLPDYCFLG